MASEEEVKMFQQLAVLGWRPPEGGMDPQIAQIFKDVGEELREIVDTTYRNTFVDADWALKVSEWEEHMIEEESILQRQDFIKRMITVGVTPEFFQDSKRRWEKAEFSSVGKYITIGDISVLRQPSCSLKDKNEIDVSLKDGSTEMGRISLTYEHWHGDIDITKVRLKINGERFVVLNNLLVGFQNYEIIGKTNLQILEYYAGSFYSIYPHCSTESVLRLRKEGKEECVTVFPHPFVTAQEIRKEDLEIHKYDGIMCWSQGVEYRVKWIASTEVLLGGEVMEVFRYNNVLIPIRARPGKTPVLENSVSLKLAPEIAGRQILPLLQVKKMIIEEQVTKNVKVGVKIFVFRLDGSYALYLEKGKRWDLLGGQVEQGESIVGAAVRELKEEVDIDIDPRSLVYLGYTTEEGDATKWISHVMACKSTKELEQRETIRFIRGSFSSVRRNGDCRPRQVWVERHFEFISRFGDPRDFVRVLDLVEGKLSRGRDLNKYMHLVLVPYYGMLIQRMFNDFLKGKRDLTEKVFSKANFLTYCQLFLYSESVEYQTIWDVVYNMSIRMMKGPVDLKSQFQNYKNSKGHVSDVKIAKEFSVSKRVAQSILRWAVDNSIYLPEEIIDFSFFQTLDTDFIGEGEVNECICCSGKVERCLCSHCKQRIGNKITKQRLEEFIQKCRWGCLKVDYLSLSWKNCCADCRIAFLV